MRAGSASEPSTQAVGILRPGGGFFPPRSFDRHLDIGKTVVSRKGPGEARCYSRYSGLLRRPLRNWDIDMTAANTEACWRLAIALVRELTTHWRAEIREYGVSSSGGLVFDLVLKPASAECLVARSRILKERNRRTVSETADVKNFIVFRPGSRSNGYQLSALTAARDDERD